MLQLILVFDPNVPPLPYNFHRFVVMPAASWGFHPKIFFKLLTSIWLYLSSFVNLSAGWNSHVIYFQPGRVSHNLLPFGFTFAL